jgi:hypothetical protein
MKKMAIYNALIIGNILLSVFSIMLVDNYPGAWFLILFGAISALSWQEDRDELVIEQKNMIWEGSGND